MKKIIHIFVIFCISLSLFSCKVKEQQDGVAQSVIENEISADDSEDMTPQNSEPEQTEEIQQEDEEKNLTQTQNTSVDAENSALRPQGDIFAYAKSYTSDVFLCTVIDEKQLEEMPTYETEMFTTDGWYSVMYTVKIEKVYRCTYIKENEYLYVNAVFNENNRDHKQAFWTEPFEVGEKYVFGVRPEVYNGAPIMFESRQVTAHISKDNKLTPMTSMSSDTLYSCKTLEEFEESAEVKEFFKHKYEYIEADGGYYTATQKKEPNAVKSEEEIIEYISNAIVVKDPIK